MKTIKFKKILASFIVVLLPSNLFAYDVEIDGIYYNLVSKAKQATVTSGDIEYTGDVTIPEKITWKGVEYIVKNIGYRAFSYCQALRSVKIPNSVTRIENDAFEWSDHMLSVENSNTLETIGEEAFKNCSSLLSVDIPNTCTSIGNYAFSGCKSLGNIEIPNSVSSIGAQTFLGCRSLSSIVIPNSITTIGSSAFSGCSSLKSVNIPNSVEIIKGGAFRDCSSLTSIEIPSTQAGIEAETFKNCSSLTSINVPNSVTYIHNEAFMGCTKLRNVTIGNHVNNIYTNAFANCNDLENFYCNATNVPSILSNAFEGSYIEYANLYVPAESLDAYKTADVWKDFGNIRSLSDVTFVETINVSAAKNILGVDETETLIANVLPANATNKSVTWSSSNSDIVSVNAETGEITAVAYGSAEITATAMDGSNVKGSVTITVKAENYALTDGEEYLNDQEVPCDELTYTRNFTNTNWNALYVPFSMNYEDWADDFEVARLNDVHQFDDDEDGVVDRTVLELVKLKDGSSTEANTPYMIKAKEEGEKTITLTDATLYATEENSFDVTSWFTRFTFTGTYSTVSDMATKGHYALADGGLMQASSDAATLGSFRWYLDVTDRNGNLAPLKAKKVLLSFDDGETTEIKFVEANANTKTIYSISGVNAGNNKASLPKGLYISNGKKFLVK